MPTILSHAVAAAATGPFHRGQPLPRGFWLVTACCAMVPDVDVVAFALGIPYEHQLGHRGLSHSLLAALVVGLCCAWGFRRAPARVPFGLLALHFTLVTASHGLLDGLTDGGRGVAFFAPFDVSRYFFPWRPIRVSPVGLGFLTARSADGELRALGVLWSELVWVWTPSLALAAAGRLYSARRLRR